MSNEDTFNPMDFSNIPGAIDPSTLPEQANIDPTISQFSFVPGGISVADLERGEAQMDQVKFTPVAIKAPPAPNQPIQLSGASTFDSDAVSDFINNYGKKNAAAQASTRTTTNSTKTNVAGDLSYREQAKLLNSLFSTKLAPIEEDLSFDDDEYDEDDGISDEEFEMLMNEEYDDDDEEDEYEEDEYDDDDDYVDYEEDDDDEEMSAPTKCRCTKECPNKNCIFYGMDNYVFIEEIIEAKVTSRIQEMIESGKLRDDKEYKVRGNKYLSDIAESLLNYV